MTKRKHFLFGLLAAGTATTGFAQTTLTTLATFNGSNGAYPQSGLIADALGNLYGTTYAGGTNNQGTVFEIPSDTHVLRTLASFNGANGNGPESSLMMDSSGNLYGTTFAGGANNDGTVFELSAGATAPTVLASFNLSNGMHPTAALVTDASSNLFGTTRSGGAYGEGTVFEVPLGTHSITDVVSFNQSNGNTPCAPLITDAAGNFYGTTSYGGAIGFGTIFKVSAGTFALTTLASMSSSNAYPDAPLLADAAGNLFTTSNYGGTHNVGTVLELPAGANSVITLASLGNTDHAMFTYAGLIVDNAGNLFGASAGGGAPNGYGIVFELPAGVNTLTTLYTFSGVAGENPWYAPIVDAAGNFYGTTSGGGANSVGTIFELSGTGFVVPEPASLGLLAVGGVGLLARRRRQSVFTHRVRKERNEELVEAY